jgi:hypothetical protein
VCLGYVTSRALKIGNASLVAPIDKLSVVMVALRLWDLNHDLFELRLRIPGLVLQQTVQLIKWVGDGRFFRGDILR